LALVFVQIALGALTVLTGKAVLPTTAHVVTGAAISACAGRHPAHAPAPPRGRVPARRRRPGRPRRVVSASASIVVPRRTAVADYLELTKPRITLTVVMTALVGYVMGTRGPLSFSRLGVALVGTALVAAGASALEHGARAADGTR